jgi:glutamate synthase domain-containing protein 2
VTTFRAAVEARDMDAVAAMLVHADVVLISGHDGGTRVTHTGRAGESGVPATGHHNRSHR